MKKQWIEQLADSSHIGILVVDKERNNLFVNRHLCDMFGYEEQFLLKHTAEILHVNHTTFSNFSKLAFEAVLQGTPLGVDYQFKRADGSLIWVHISGDPIKNENEVLWTIVDISARMEMQEQERILKERLELALLGNSDALWDFDLTNNTIYYSPRWKEMLGYKDDELPNDPTIWNAKVHKEDEKRVLASVQEHLDGKSSYVDIEHRLHHKDGSWIWVRTRAKAIFNDDAKAIRLIGTNTDITEQKNIQLIANHQSKILEQLQESVNTIDLKGKIVSWNKASQKIFGYTKEEAIGEHISILRLDDRASILPNIFEILQKTDEYTVETQLRHKSNRTIEVSLTLSFLRDEDGNPTHIIGNARDITKRKKIEKELEESNYNLNQYIEALDKIDIGLFVVDEDYTVRYMNKTMIKWFGDQKGKTCYASVANLAEPCPYCKLGAVLHDKAKVTYDPTTPDGQSFDIVATSIRNADGTMSKMEVIRNVTEQKKVQQQLYHQAHYDALTELPNRVLLTDRLNQAIKKAKLSKTKLALLFIDLDHFKEINDSLGHSFGDEILKIVATKLKNLLKESDTIARLGGDEFVMILEDIEQIQEASLLANKTLTTLSEAMEIDDRTLYISSSIGISIYPDDGNSVQNLLKFADSAMYKAKEEGRNNYQFYNSSMTELAFERVLMETSLRAALKNDEFVVYYQPQVNGESDTLIGMEALVRWKHPTMGIISPAKFIPLAESTGLIVELDRFVMRSAIGQLAAWNKQGLKPGILALNLAIKQIEREDFVPFFMQLMEETSCMAGCIELEVTEGQIMKNPEEAINVLQQLSDLGIELAIDDFGTGYSSLSYLKRLPINKLKIDQEFIRNLPGDKEDAAIAKAVIALAESLNLKIIAEGVETIEQKDFIVESGCRNIQGYFYSKPLPAQELELLLKKSTPFA